MKLSHGTVYIYIYANSNVTYGPLQRSKGGRTEQKSLAIKSRIDNGEKNLKTSIRQKTTCPITRFRVIEKIHITKSCTPHKESSDNIMKPGLSHHFGSFTGKKKKKKSVEKSPLRPCGSASSAVVFNYKRNNGSVVFIQF